MDVNCRLSFQGHGHAIGHVESYVWYNVIESETRNFVPRGTKVTDRAFRINKMKKQWADHIAYRNNNRLRKKI